MIRGGTESETSHFLALLSVPIYRVTLPGSLDFYTPLVLTTLPPKYVPCLLAWWTMPLPPPKDNNNAEM